MNDVGNQSGGGGNNGSDSSHGSSMDSKLCRDFIRNVCHRGKNCKFIHAENIKIRNEPIFCHDFQQNRCHRPSCKFIHCSREIEEHYKKTGELPESVYEGQNGQNGHGNGNGSSSDMRSRNGDGNMRNKQINRNSGNGGMDSSYNSMSSDVPICKDYLKGVCNRPPGSCKYRHVNANSQNDNGRMRNGSGRNVNNGNGKSSGGVRRRGSDVMYDSAPEIKKIRPNETNNGFGYGGNGGDDFNEDFYVGNTTGQGYSALPPHSEAHQIQNAPHGPPTSAPDSHAFTQFHQTPATSTYAPVTANARNGYNSGGAGDSSVSAYIQSAETIKALEDENFMLKRRIEELKTSNEFLLNQNAQLRLNSSLSVSRTSVGVENVQVQPAVGVASVANGVVQTMVSMAQPMGITPSLSVAATQPLSTISTLPTVSMPQVSISQALPVVSIAQHQPQVYPMVTTQGVIPQPPNLS